MNQNLELSLSAYWCPSDRDAYLRPRAAYKWTDNIIMEAGANIFVAGSAIYGCDEYAPVIAEMRKLAEAGKAKRG